MPRDKSGKAGATSGPSGRHPGLAGKTRHPIPCLPPVSDINGVKSYWGTLTPEQQLDALTINLQTLQERLNASSGKVYDGKEAATEATPDLGMRLQEAVERLQEHGTMKTWSYDGLDFYQKEAFKKALQESILPEHLRAALPTASQEAVDREALCALLRKVSGIRQQIEDSKITDGYDAEMVGSGGTEDGRHQRLIQGVKMLLDVVAKTDEGLYNYVKIPITSVLDGRADSNTFDHAAGIRWDALHMLPAEHVLAIYSWLAQKLQCLQWLLVDTPSRDVAHMELWGKGVFTLSHDCQGLTMVPKVLGILQRSNITHDYIYGSGETLCQVSSSLSAMRDADGRVSLISDNAN